MGKNADQVPEKKKQLSRREMIKSGLAFSVLATAGLGAAGKAVAGEVVGSLRYPPENIDILKPEFSKYRIFNASIEKLAGGFRWLEGPLWVGDGRYLLFSDIPNNRIMRWDEITEATTVYRENSGHSNGMARDRQGRLIVCEGGKRRVTRTEYNGSITVLADIYEGKKLNSPNDIICHSDGSLWFTDPPFQIGNNYEGHVAAQESPHALYRIDGVSGKLTRILDTIQGPNGLCFSPDEKILYIVEGRAKPDRLVWAFTVGANGSLSNKKKHITALNYGALDGIKCDKDGNIWAGWGSSGHPEGKPEMLDGVMVFNPAGEAIGHIRLPERCANLCFGGEDSDRLFMTGCHSLYAIYVNTQGAGLI